MVIHLPQKGAKIGAYEVIEQLGQGGGGHVYKAERGGRNYAVKVLATLDVDGWTRREVTALVNLPLDNVVRFVGYDKWPDAETGYPCIIMEFVSGLTLDFYVLRHNPSTRRALTIFLKIARALREVFRLGVLHRDIKESNIIIRSHDGEPILIDFGFSSVAGMPTVTEAGRLPPGTPEYRSPEAMRFLASMTEEDSYTYSLSDELWALGVTLYWLLTDVLPFGNRREPGLNARIRLDSPPHPCVVNPRLPESVSRLCLRMLEKDPQSRFQNHDEICGAVEALLSAHEGDAGWDVPLIDPESPHRVTTVGGPNADKPKNEQEKEVAQWIGEKPRRGLWREGDALQPPAPGKLPPPVGFLEGQARASPDVPAVDVAPGEVQEDAGAAPPRGEPAGLVAGAAAPPVQGRAEARAPPARRGASGVRRWVLGAGPFPTGRLLLDLLKRPPLVLVAVLALVALVVGSVGAWRSEAPPVALAGKTAPPPSASAVGGQTEGAAPVREVAQPHNPAEANAGAAPVRAQPPAPLPNAMPRKPDTTKKPDDAPKHQTQRAGRLPALKKAAAVSATCALIEGCTGGTAQVRPTPAPVECPADWQATHKRLGIGSGTVVLQGERGYAGDTVPLPEGPVRVVTDDVTGLPEGTLLSGTWQLGEGRIYSTFTQAQIPGGDTYPVCLVIGRDTPAAMPSGPDCPEGLGDCPAPESRPGNVKTFTVLDVYPKGYRF
ncbi:protein kinase [Archangium violaceum]|uniref:serine/threonine protein kinase n=1 Tax=Archangium violaceum TaxID=83451 RepID=UPI00193B1563|nr:serine/threonine-protein kinase [Archangium violaceum]QRK10563.1 protein kinase [Archangium violaceum]